MACLDDSDTRWTAEKVAAIVGTARVQRTVARRSRQVARVQRERAQQTCMATRRHGQELIGLKWQARRACYDRHGTLLAMWAGDEDSTDAAGGDAVQGVALDRLVQRLFEAGLAVTACRRLVGPEAAARLDSVTGMVDSMIHDLRQAVFDSHCQTREDDPVAPTARTGVVVEEPPRPYERESVVPALEAMSLTVEGLWRQARNDDHDEAAVALGEASQSLYRALIALGRAGRVL